MSAVERVVFGDGEVLRAADLRELFDCLDLGLRHHVRAAHDTWGVLVGLGAKVTAVGTRRTVTVQPGAGATPEGQLLVLARAFSLPLPPGDTPVTVVLRAEGPGPQARPRALGPGAAPDPAGELVLCRYLPQSGKLETDGLRRIARRPGPTRVLTGRTAITQGSSLCWTGSVDLPPGLTGTPTVMAALDGPPPRAVCVTTVEVTSADADRFTVRVRHALPPGSPPPDATFAFMPVGLVWTAVLEAPPAEPRTALPPADHDSSAIAHPQERAAPMTPDDPTAPLPSVARPAFFEQQVLTAADLSRLVATEREVRALHHRTLHGWGICRGLQVKGVLGARTVLLEQGYALDAAGRELLLPAPVTLDVPAVSGAPGNPDELLLTMSWTPDDEAPAEMRDGSCGAFGAVRLRDDPTVRWLPEPVVRNGYDLVLARVAVSEGALAASPDGAPRRELHPGPHAAAGSGVAGKTVWSAVSSADGSVIGVRTELDTSSGGFGGRPTYLVRLTGTRETVLPATGAPCVLDGTPYVESSDARHLVVVVPLHSGVTAAAPGGAAVPLNPPQLLTGSLPALVTTTLAWSVAWVGVEG